MSVSAPAARRDCAIAGRQTSLIAGTITYVFKPATGEVTMGCRVFRR
jgi:hypothetical protein